MNSNGPVIVIDDDVDDQAILKEIFDKLNYPNEVKFFNDGQQALDYLYNTDIVPFLILSDVNMPKLDGFALRTKIREYAKLDIRCIPYLFFTTSSNKKTVMNAYSTSAQGFFIKPHSIVEIEDTIRSIMDYWKKCIAPNTY